MNKILFYLSLVCVGFTACVKSVDSPEDTLKSIKFSSDTAFVYIGESQEFVFDVNPLNYNKSSLIWYSSNADVASISESGIFKANKIGEALITVTNSSKSVTVTFRLVVLPLAPAVNPLQLTDKATDISVGANGAVYITGTDIVSASGGYSIKKLNGAAWTTIAECAAVRVAVGPDGKPWVVNKSNLIFRYDGGPYWTTLPGEATDIAVGTDGTVFIIGADEVSATGGYSIRKWNGTGWTTLKECAGTRIAVDASGIPWVVNKSNKIFKYVGANVPWKQIPGTATDIAIGANGAIFITGTDLVSANGYNIKKYNGYNWTTLNGLAGVNLSVSATGSIFWTDKNNSIFKN
jgi:hypothetical protein